MPVLLVTSLPIDDKWQKLDPRVEEAVKSCDLLIAEENKSALRLLAACGARETAYVLINEHSSDSDRENVLKRIAESSISVMVSDAGTPAIADPDYRIIDMAHKIGIEVKSVPGPCSITTALSVSGFDSSSFIFLGFPPRRPRDRERFFKDLAAQRITSVFLERPYALKQTLNDLKSIDRDICVCINLGGGSLNKSGVETIFRGRADNIIDKIGDIKAAFAVVVDKAHK